MQKQEIIVSAFLHRNGKLLITKRAATKKFLPNKWELPGGHVEFGEEMQNGLKREIHEELGVELLVDDPIYVFTYVSGDTHMVEVDYLAELADPQTAITLNPEDHSEFRWVTQG